MKIKVQQNGCIIHYMGDVISFHLPKPSDSIHCLPAKNDANSISRFDIYPHIHRHNEQFYPTRPEHWNAQDSCRYDRPPKPPNSPKL
jgi:hypothetical protein